ncbi:Hpt domain-containing protein [Candidatus Sumerlaeota bacterium]|nr:Hpt domain-containing protein [Candidatus Sumerlaeota bacterium]
MATADGKPGQDSVTPPPVDLEAECPVFDKAGLLERLGGDEDLADRVLEVFLEDAARQIEELRQLGETGDREGVARRAHSIKSAAGSVGATVVAAAALDVELAARESAADIAGPIAVVCGSFDRFKTALRGQAG